MMGVVRFVRDRLRRAQPSDDEETQDQKKASDCFGNQDIIGPTTKSDVTMVPKPDGPASSLSDRKPLSSR